MKMEKITPPDIPVTFLASEHLLFLEGGINSVTFATDRDTSVTRANALSERIGGIHVRLEAVCSLGETVQQDFLHRFSAYPTTTNVS